MAWAGPGPQLYIGLHVCVILTQDPQRSSTERLSLGVGGQLGHKDQGLMSMVCALAKEVSSIL